MRDAGLALDDSGSSDAGDAGKEDASAPNPRVHDSGPLACSPMEWLRPTCVFCDPEQVTKCEVRGQDTSCEAATYVDNGDGTLRIPSFCSATSGIKGRRAQVFSSVIAKLPRRSPCAPV